MPAEPHYPLNSQKSHIYYLGSVYLVRAALPSMQQAGQGHIVLVSSGAGLLGVYGLSAYTPTKFALRGLAEVLRAELRPEGISVSVVYPPDTDTPMLREEIRIRPEITSQIAAKAKAMTADEVADAILKGVAKKKFSITKGFELGALAYFSGVIAPLVNRFQFDPLIARLHKRAKQTRRFSDYDDVTDQAIEPTTQLLAKETLISSTPSNGEDDPMSTMENACESDEITSSTHGENFSIAGLFKTDATTLSGRVKPFADYYRDARANGQVHYGREIVSAVSHRTQVRSLDGGTREMIMLGSNNYLGLTTHPHVTGRIKHALDDFGAGMGGPPLLGGMSQLHIALEKRLSQMKGTEDTMLFGSGYQANLGWVTTLLRDDDVLFYDEYNHASLYDGIALTAASANFKAIRFAHNDMAHLEKLLIRSRKDTSRKHRQIFVATEGVYSMDGDLAPLPRISALCAQYGAILMVDNAHGSGVMGKTGSGTGEHFGMHGGVDLWLGSFSKAFGMTGGFISATREIIDYLRFCSRSYIFSAHLPITTVAGVLGGLEVLEKEPELIVRLHQNADYLGIALKKLGFKTQREAAIIPVLIPSKVNIREVCKLFDDENIFLNSIEYPAVPRDGQRLRLSVMATHTKKDLDLAIAAFARVGKAVGILQCATRLTLFDKSVSCYALQHCSLL